MPEITGFSHVSLSVRDLDASTTFYCEVFGFQILEPITHDMFRENVLVHPAGAVLCLQQHSANAGESFEPQRTGMDHVALKVGTRAELDEWTAELERRGITHSPVADRHYGAVLCLRDPDDIQLELFYRENHP